MFILAVIVALIDQATKILVLHTLQPGEPVRIVGNLLRFYLTRNSGAAFSLGANVTWLFTTIQLAFIVGIVLWARKQLASFWINYGLALIAGGTLGNVIDRLLRTPGFFVGHVVDFISLRGFAVFNVGDMAISAGVVLVVIGIIQQERAARPAHSHGEEAK